MAKHCGCRTRTRSDELSRLMGIIRQALREFPFGCLASESLLVTAVAVGRAELGDQPWPDNIPGGTWHPGKLSHTTSFGAQDLSAHRAHPGRQTAMPAEEPRLWVAKAVRRGLRARHLRWQRAFRRGLGLSEQRPAFDSRPDAAGHLLLWSAPRR